MSHPAASLVAAFPCSLIAPLVLPVVVALRVLHPEWVAPPARQSRRVKRPREHARLPEAGLAADRPVPVRVLRASEWVNSIPPATKADKCVTDASSGAPDVAPRTPKQIHDAVCPPTTLCCQMKSAAWPSVQG